MRGRVIFAAFAVVALVSVANSKPSNSRGKGEGAWRNLGLGKGVMDDKGLSKELRGQKKLAERFLQTRGFAEGFWRRFFCAKWLNWPWVQEETTFSTERIPEIRTLIGTCSVDVGTCPLGSCSNRTLSDFFDCPGDGYICPVTETRTADCGLFGQLQYQYVSACKCCKDEGIKVKVVVMDSAANTPLRNIEILFGKNAIGKTDLSGSLSSNVESETESFVVRAVDRTSVYMDAIKIVDIADDFRGPVEIELLMIKKFKPVEINSTVETKLSLSIEPGNPDVGSAFVVISPDSFKTKDGALYSGPVKASITFIDTNNDAEALIPGRFLTPVGRNSLENMISDGVFAFDFKDAQGNELTTEPVEISVRKGMQLWRLNPITGLWEPVEVISGRKRRQVVLTEEFLIRVQNGGWYNIDKIPGAPRCYFKARIFNQTSGEEITNSLTASFRPELIAFTAQNQRMRLYAGDTNKPSDTCFELRCVVADNPDETMAGFINMTSLENVLVGNIFLPSLSYMKPKPLDQYDPLLQTKLGAVQYTIAPNGLDIFLNYISDIEGPLFTDLETCTKSTADMPALHFYKPEPPNYEPFPDDNEICTARIAFRGNRNFYNFTSGLTVLPNLTGISTWKQNGQNYFFTDTVVLERSTVDGREFIFACLKYRCSPGNTTNESVKATTVYLDIKIRNFTYTYSYPDENGTLVTRNTSVPQFYCYGFCEEEICYKESVNANGTSIEGSFKAPGNAGAGSHFLNPATNDCKTWSRMSPSAFEFYCRANGEGDGRFDRGPQ